MNFYLDYHWKKGRPIGINKTTNSQFDKTAFKIIHDPYYKRISVELFQFGVFSKTIYDSCFLDFRKLTPQEQSAWEKTALNETSSMIIDHDDRALLYEYYQIQNKRLLFTDIFSIHGIFLARQIFFSPELGDSIEGSLLTDSYFHPVCFQNFNRGKQTETNQPINWDVANHFHVEDLRKRYRMNKPDNYIPHTPMSLNHLMQPQ